MHKYIEGESQRRSRTEGCDPPGRRSKMKVFPVICGTAFKNKGVQTLLDAVVDYLPTPLDVPPVEGIDPETGEEDASAGGRQGAVLGAGFKIMTDPFVGQLTFIRVYSGQLKTGDSVLNPRTGRTERIGRLLKMHANKREEITEILCRRHLRLRRSEEHHHRRHDLRREASDRARVDRVPGAGDRGCRGAEDQEPTRKRWASRWRKLAQEDPTFKVQHRSRQRPDHHLRYGRASPGDHRRPHDARVQGGGQCRQAAGCLSRDDPQEVGGGRQVHSPDRRQRATTVTCKHPPGAERAGQGLRVHQRSQGRRDSQGIHQADRPGHQGSHGRRRSRRLRNGRRQGHRCTTAAITMSTRTKWPSRSPVRWRSRKPRARPARCCWSR